MTGRTIAYLAAALVVTAPGAASAQPFAPVPNALQYRAPVYNAAPVYVPPAVRQFAPQYQVMQPPPPPVVVVPWGAFGSTIR